jgi:hypothetical protein
MGCLLVEFIVVQAAVLLSDPPELAAEDFTS